MCISINSTGILVYSLLSKILDNVVFNEGVSKWCLCINGSQLAKMKKSIPDMSLP